MGGSNSVAPGGGGAFAPVVNGQNVPTPSAAQWRCVRTEMTTTVRTLYRMIRARQTNRERQWHHEPPHTYRLLPSEFFPHVLVVALAPDGAERHRTWAEQQVAGLPDRPCRWREIHQWIRTNVSAQALARVASDPSTVPDVPEERWMHNVLRGTPPLYWGVRPMNEPDLHGWRVDWTLVDGPNHPPIHRSRPSVQAIWNRVHPDGVSQEARNALYRTVGTDEVLLKQLAWLYDVCRNTRVRHMRVVTNRFILAHQYPLHDGVVRFMRDTPPEVHRLLFFLFALGGNWTFHDTTVLVRLLDDLDTRSADVRRTDTGPHIRGPSDPAPLGPPPPPPEPVPCIICCDRVADVLFRPCCHRLVCYDECFHTFERDSYNHTRINQQVEYLCYQCRQPVTGVVVNHPGPDEFVADCDTAESLRRLPAGALAFDLSTRTRRA